MFIEFIKMLLSILSLMDFQEYFDAVRILIEKMISIFFERKIEKHIN